MISFALLSTQGSSLRWSRSRRWRSASGPDTTPPTSSSDGSGAPSPRGRTSTDASEHRTYICSARYSYMYASGFYIRFYFLFTATHCMGLASTAWIYYQALKNTTQMFEYNSSVLVSSIGIKCLMEHFGENLFVLSIKN